MVLPPEEVQAPEVAVTNPPEEEIAPEVAHALEVANAPEVANASIEAKVPESYEISMIYVHKGKLLDRESTKIDDVYVFP